MRNIPRVFLVGIVAFALTSCGRSSNSRIELPLALASFSENYVGVSIQLTGTPVGYFLSAEFTPPEGYHLYSKDIPISGVEGLGRPTLLEISADSALSTIGELLESVSATVPDFEPKELLVYPAGVVTLSLPIRLPAGNEWTEQSVLITYMACNEDGCKPPVVRKAVSIRIPGRDNIKQDSK